MYVKMKTQCQHRYARVLFVVVISNVNVISPFKRVNTHENSPNTHTLACTHTFTYSLARAHTHGGVSNALVPAMWIVSISYTIKC